VQKALTGRSARTWAGVAGAVLCLLAIAFLARRGLALGSRLGDGLAAISPARAAAATVVYGAGGLLLGAAWVALVRLAAGPGPGAARLFRTHLQSQLAKYVPGNVFHFAYRHVAARQEGVGHAPLALALGLESILLMAAASMLALVLAHDPRLLAVAPWAGNVSWVALLLPVLAWIALALVARRWPSTRLSPGRSAPWFAVVLALDLLFFVLAGGALRLLAPDPGGLPFAAWCSWLALAWLVGYVVPGAPGGLGLREFVLVQGLGPTFGEGGAMAIAIGYRLVTLGADAMLAAGGLLLAAHARKR
jgi:hypothetical protein